MSDRNKAIARAVFDVWGTGELDRPYDPHGDQGLDGMKATIAANRERFSELRLDVQDQIAEGDRVATRWTCTMVQAGSGKRATIAGITIDRFEDGKIVEAWRSMDALGLASQLA